MLESIWSGYAGLLSFSKGLSVISNNVANMNSPGFKSSEAAFRDLVYHYGVNGGNNGDEASLQIGEGVDVGSTRVKYRQGDLRDTGNPLDMAIDGNGFFVLRKDGNTFYTRAGQFEFNSDDVLVDQNSGARVAGFRAGHLEDISLAGLRVSPSQTTASVIFSGNLSRSGVSHTVNPVTVYDTTGNSHALKLILTNNNGVTAGSWLVEVQDEAGGVLANGEIRYAINGLPTAGFNTISFTLAPSGIPSSTIMFNFGDAGSSSGSTNFPGGTTSSLVVQSQDGYGAGALVESTFDSNGYFTTKYSNGQTTKHQQIALAWFSNLQSLLQVGHNLFANESGQQVMLNAPGSGVMGKLAPQKIELSNVELTEQFTDMVVIQRGYQASSQIISVTNEMIQQLLGMRAQR